MKFLDSTILLEGKIDDFFTEMQTNREARSAN